MHSKLKWREKAVFLDSGGKGDCVTDPSHECPHTLHSSAHKLDDNCVCLLLHHTSVLVPAQTATHLS